MTSLIGNQKGGLSGLELIFVNEYYSKRLLRIPFSLFYTEAIKSTAKLTLSKRIDDLSTEKVFYNPVFLDRNLKTIPIPKRCERHGIFSYGEVVDEFIKQSYGLPHKPFVANIFPKIAHTDLIGKIQNTIFITKLQAQLTFRNATCKDIYGELIGKNYKEHHLEEKWENKFPEYTLDWPKIWKSVNNSVASEDSRTVVWEQIHLYDYCTYSYNKWKKAQEKCPFCLNIPSSKFHLTLECDIVNKLWEDLEPHLMRIHNAHVTDLEKVFGLTENSPNIILRNWLTFILRQCIATQEGAAYKNKKGPRNIDLIKRNFNQRVKIELMQKYLIFNNLGRAHSFRNIFAVNNYLVTWENNCWNALTLY